MREANMTVKQLADRLKKETEKGIIGVVEGDLSEIIDDLIDELEGLGVPFTYNGGTLTCGSKTLS